jgi:hypothetical protein
MSDIDRSRLVYRRVLERFTLALFLSMNAFEPTAKTVIAPGSSIGDFVCSEANILASLFRLNVEDGERVAFAWFETGNYFNFGKLT